jgi:DNA repair protein RecO (recombination protein O)
MLHKTRGIVFKTTLYSESSVIVQIFTEKFGIQSYMINGVKKPKAKIRMNMLQSLHLVDLVVYHKPAGGIHRISELRPFPVFRTIPYNILKSTIIQFLNEVLHKSIQQQHADENVFDFVFNALLWFDETEETVVNFHLAFLLKLSRFLGFAPNKESRSDQAFFDLQEGDFKSMPPVHPYFLIKEDAKLFISLFFVPFEEIAEIKLTSVKRRYILDKILVYYTLHTASFGEIKSRQVLEEVLS